MYSRKERYTQAKPYQPLPYKAKTVVVHNRYDSGRDALNNFAAIADMTVDGDVPTWNPLIDKAYARFVDKTGEQSLWAVNLLELNQTVSLIAGATLRLTRAARALKRRDLRGAADALSMKFVPSKASVRQSAASNWLKYHFGVEPLVHDIANAVETLQNPLPHQWIRVSASDSHTLRPYGADSVTSNPNAQYPSLSSSSFQHLVQLKRRLAMGARVYINNPNLYLANKLGFVNPLVVGLEVIPFSFMLDWFTNLSSFFSQGTDLLGLGVEDPWTMWHVKSSENMVYTYTYRWYDQGSWHYGGGSQVFGCTGMQMRRSTDITKPPLYLKPLKIWGWQRNLTVLALAQSVFSGK